MAVRLGGEVLYDRFQDEEEIDLSSHDDKAPVIVEPAGSSSSQGGCARCGRRAVMEMLMTLGLTVLIIVVIMLFTTQHKYSQGSEMLCALHCDNHGVLMSGCHCECKPGFRGDRCQAKTEVCAVNVTERRSCGATSPDECTDTRGCCWSAGGQRDPVGSDPWCFYPEGVVHYHPRCVLLDSERKPCGGDNITEQECTGSYGCCWLDSKAAGVPVPSCYYKAGCNLDIPAAERRMCGHDRITQSECVNNKGCCWSRDTQGAPACFYPDGILHFDPLCAVSDAERQDCGYCGISETECVNIRGCCWDPARTPGVPWCYYKACNDSHPDCNKVYLLDACDNATFVQKNCKLMCNLCVAATGGHIMASGKKGSCHYPFTYKNVTYENPECVCEDRDRPWCYLDPAQTHWGYCKTHQTCPGL